MQQPPSEIAPTTTAARVRRPTIIGSRGSARAALLPQNGHTVSSVRTWRWHEGQIAWVVIASHSTRAADESYARRSGGGYTGAHTSNRGDGLALLHQSHRKSRRSARRGRDP